jgi:hypothetical protein
MIISVQATLTAILPVPETLSDTISISPTRNNNTIYTFESSRTFYHVKVRLHQRPPPLPIPELSSPRLPDSFRYAVRTHCWRYFSTGGHGQKSDEKIAQLKDIPRTPICYSSILPLYTLPFPQREYDSTSTNPPPPSPLPIPTLSSPLTSCFLSDDDPFSCYPLVLPRFLCFVDIVNNRCLCKTYKVFSK